MNLTQTSNYFWFALTIAFILIDQLIKLAAVSFGWSVFLNNQFAFSLPVPIAIMYMIYAGILFGMSFYIFKTWLRFSVQQKFAWTLVYAGGLSNIGERILLGHVRDFIYIAGGVLNVADFFILLGLVLLLASTRGTQSKIFPSSATSELEK